MEIVKNVCFFKNGEREKSLRAREMSKVELKENLNFVGISIRFFGTSSGHA